MHEKLSESIKHALADPVVAERLSVAIAASWRDPDVRSRRVAGMALTKDQRSEKARGSRWINDGTTDRKLRRGEELPNGWFFGRLFEIDWTPEMRENLSVAIRAFCADPEVRKHKSDAMAEVWQRAEHREKIAETNIKPEVVARKSAAMSASHGTPEFREAAKRRAISQFSTPEAREAHRQRSLEQHADPEKHARNVAARRLAGSRGNKGWRWITDGVETRQMLGTDPLPDGYRYGDGHVRNAGKNWITDGARNRMIDPEVPIPEGFRLGKTVPRRTTSVQAQ